MRIRYLAACAAIVFAAPAFAQDDLRTSIAEDYDTNLEALYQHFHANPELSFREVETAARLAEELRALGYDVTENVGQTGIVAVLENGEGPTLMLRADMDGLPVEEQTGLDFASTVTGTDLRGQTSPVMHACAHDTHMTALVGTARQMVERRDSWSGTLVLIGQPAEEIGLGAQAMLEDGLYERFPTPEAVIAFHTFAGVPTGQIHYAPGYAMANVDSVDIIVHGVGGHGAYPHTTKDPVYLSAQIIMALQSLVSREVSPLDPAVITVGAIHGGTKHNIISDQVHMQLTVRSYSDDVRDHLLNGIRRVAHAQAESYGLPENLWPDVSWEEEYTPSLYNDPGLAEEAAAMLREQFGSTVVREASPVMGGEDFAQYHRTDEEIPVFMFWVGGTSQEVLDGYRERGETPPSNHSPFFAPDAEGSITLATEAMTVLALDYLAAADAGDGAE